MCIWPRTPSQPSLWYRLDTGKANPHSNDSALACSFILSALCSVLRNLPFVSFSQHLFALCLFRPPFFGLLFLSFFLSLSLCICLSHPLSSSYLHETLLARQGYEQPRAILHDHHHSHHDFQHLFRPQLLFVIVCGAGIQTQTQDAAFLALLFSNLCPPMPRKGEISVPNRKLQLATLRFGTQPPNRKIV